MSIRLGSNRRLHTNLAEVGDLIDDFSPEEAGINLLFPETEPVCEQVFRNIIQSIPANHWIYFGYTDRYLQEFKQEIHTKHNCFRQQIKRIF